MTETLGHCPSCTCTAGAEVGTYCTAEVTIRHETFECLEWKGHDPPHRGPLVSPPCPVCEGLDRHAGGCLRIGHDPENTDTVEVTWCDGEPIELVSA